MKLKTVENGESEITEVQLPPTFGEDFIMVSPHYVGIGLGITYFLSKDGETWREIAVLKPDERPQGPFEILIQWMDVWIRRNTPPPN